MSFKEGWLGGGGSLKIRGCGGMRGQVPCRAARALPGPSRPQNHATPPRCSDLQVKKDHASLTRRQGAEHQQAGK